MNLSTSRFAIGALIAALIVPTIATLTLPARAQSAPAGQTSPVMDQAMPGHDQMPGMMPQQGQMPAMGSSPAMPMAGTTPTMPGQDAFGAIQEIVRILEADPTTDWSKIDLEALRQHLIDMNEVTLGANAMAKPVDGGLEIEITGAGRTLAAIRRMIPAHAHEINGFNGWSTKTDMLPNGVRLTVTSSDPQEIRHIRGLGFIGILASGSHHQPHHLAIAKGEILHMQ